MACCGEVDVAHGVEGNVACVVVGGLEDAEAGLVPAVRQADHQKGAACFLEDLRREKLQVHLEVHLPGYLMEIQI